MTDAGPHASPASRPGPGKQSKPRNRRRGVVGIVLLIVLLLSLPVASVAYLYVGLEGGWQVMEWNRSPAPDQDTPEVVAKRAEARSRAEAGLRDLSHSKVLASGPMSYSAYCERGQNNYKVHQGYRHDCYVVAAQFYSWKGTFPAMARALDQELQQAGWQSEYQGGGLLRLADDYQQSKARPEDRTPGPLVSSDFSEIWWHTCYDKGERHICFQFADRDTDLADQADSFDWRQSRGLEDVRSYADTRETVGSRAAIDALLSQADGVLFASSTEPYYSIQR